METVLIHNLRWRVFFHALMFVLGFTTIFIIGWGGAATLVGQFFGSYKSLLAKIGGMVVIVFGLATIGLVKIPWLYYDTRPDWQGQGRRGFVASILMGVFFAAGWTPCIGTTLGAILTLGFSQETSWQAMILSSGYALGLGLPFLVLGLSFDRAASILVRFRRHLPKIQKFSGAFMVGIGILILTNQMAWIAIWAQRNGFFIDLNVTSSSVPSYLIALTAGFVSFLSPCVLPLVPAYLGYLSGHAFSSSDSYQ